MTKAIAPFSYLVCPLSKAPLRFDKEHQELICEKRGIAYPIRDNIPIMVVSEARMVKLKEKL